jgi:VWFA-related protein
MRGVARTSVWGLLAIGLASSVMALSQWAVPHIVSAAQTSTSKPSAPTRSSDSPSAQPPSSQASSTAQTAKASSREQSSPVLQATTRLVTVDVVATNSHGVVRDLKAEDFEISDNGRQKIEKFAFIDRSASGSVAKSANGSAAANKGFYTNQAAIQRMTSPPTVILMDSLNSDFGDMMRVRQHMMMLLKSLPTDSPVAVMLLGESLRQVQGFTTDPELLRAAVDKAMSPAGEQTPMPQDDPNSTSLMAYDANEDQEDTMVQVLEDFEKDTYANQMDIRVDTTLDALNAIAHYLSGYTGRKNLIWVSESFPIVLWPDPDFGTTTAMFESSRAYGDQLEQAANALSDAQVAVYPVDARGLDTSQIFQASSNLPTRPNQRARSLSAQIRRENNARINAQQTMDALAQESGGRTCKNTNDLSRCVEAALNDGASYYEFAYYPQDIKWDGAFHKITVKTTRSGVKLDYRRGYFARDEQAQLAKTTPEKRLQQVCEDFLPSTDIPVEAQVVAPDAADEMRYVVAVPSGLSFAADGQAFKINAEMAACVYAKDGTTFRFYPRDLSRSFGSVGLQDVQEHGLRGFMDFPYAETPRVRVAVLDEGTGLTGALDIPIRKEDLAFAVAVPPSAAAVANAAPATPTSASKNVQPDPQKTTIGFSVPSGLSGELDWGGDKLIYHGDLGVDQTAPAFFARFYFNSGFHCEAGKLIPSDPSSSQPPRLRLTFGNQNGLSATVDLEGAQPEYSGTLPVDDSAKAFFARLWYLCHCTSVPGAH